MISATYNKTALNKTRNGEISPFVWRIIANWRNVVNFYTQISGVQLFVYGINFAKSNFFRKPQKKGK